MAQNLNKLIPRSPTTSFEFSPSQKPHIEIERATCPVGVDGAERPSVHVRVFGGEGSVDEGLVPLGLFEGRDSGLGDGLGPVVDHGVNGVVVDGELLVRVVDGEPGVPVAGDGGVGGGEVSEGERVDSELGEARAEDEPEDEDDHSHGNEDDDHRYEEGADEGA